MKKSLTICLFFLSCHAWSQNFYAGLSFGLNKAAVISGDASQTVYIGNPKPYSFTSKPYSYGEGNSFGGYAGYMFNEYLGAESGFYYLPENSRTVLYNENSPDPTTVTFIAKRKFTRITPGIKLTVGQKWLTGYMRMGADIAMGIKLSTETTTSVDYYYNLTPSHWYEKKEYNDNFSVGIYNGLGINFRFTKRFSAYCEIIGYLHQWNPKEEILISYTVDGEEMIHSMDDTSFEPTDHFPLSSLGLSAGIQFTLTKKE